MSWYVEAAAPPRLLDATPQVVRAAIEDFVRTALTPPTSMPAGMTHDAVVANWRLDGVDVTVTIGVRSAAPSRATRVAVSAAFGGEFDTPQLAAASLEQRLACQAAVNQLSDRLVQHIELVLATTPPTPSNRRADGPDLS